MMKGNYINRDREVIKLKIVHIIKDWFWLLWFFSMPLIFAQKTSFKVNFIFALLLTLVVGAPLQLICWILRKEVENIKRANVTYSVLWAVAFLAIKFQKAAFNYSVIINLKIVLLAIFPLFFLFDRQ